MTLAEFTEKTASASPTPGGGSVSALVGALAAALSAMVGGLTVGKKKYADVWEEMGEAVTKMQALSDDLLKEAERDCSSFDQFMAALALPKDTPREQEIRTAAMQEGLKVAIAAPLDVARKASGIFPCARLMAEKGNKTALSDALVSAMMARTCVLGAAYNVRINLQSVKDREYADRIYEEIGQLEKDAQEQEESIRALAAL